ncbi:hypothetical protein PR048_016332 [Dryococelus australis]|uniref:Small integral membrane protein 12 n=1 Tax=Dryococelus australis TaxID=614101 RepID=A0ABQ9HJF2_9NEOP|nr:hypothetical protein PR048_016332 [Dryococelus australis]
MLPVIFTALRSYAPYITLPVAAVIGFIGYKIEGLLSDRYTPYEKSIEEKREERFVEESLKKNTLDVESLKGKRFVPFSVLQKNVSPSLAAEDK